MAFANLRCLVQPSGTRQLMLEKGRGIYHHSCSRAGDTERLFGYRRSEREYEDDQSRWLLSSPKDLLRFRLKKSKRDYVQPSSLDKWDHIPCPSLQT